MVSSKLEMHAHILDITWLVARLLRFPGTRPKYPLASFLGSSSRYLSAASPAKLSSLAAEPLCAGLLPCLAHSTHTIRTTRHSKPAQLPRSVARQCLVEGSIPAASTVSKATPPPAATHRQWPRRPPWRIRLACWRMPWSPCASRHRSCGNASIRPESSWTL